MEKMTIDKHEIFVSLLLTNSLNGLMAPVRLLRHKHATKFFVKCLNVEKITLMLFSFRRKNNIVIHSTYWSTSPRRGKAS